MSVSAARSLVLVALAVLVLAGCGSGESENVDVVLVDRSKSFCEQLPNCLDRITAHVGDPLTDLSKRGGALRLLLIGSDTGAAVQAVSNEECTGVLRDAAACFQKPTLWNSIFGKSGTQITAARQAIHEDIEKGLQESNVSIGTSIFDSIMSAEALLNDRRLQPGDRKLVILSDMIEDTKGSDLPALTCVNVGAPEQNRHVLDLLRDQGRLPDLNYTTVEVFGENSRNRLNGACRERFWRAYFDRTGADLVVYGTSVTRRSVLTPRSAWHRTVTISCVLLVSLSGAVGASSATPRATAQTAVISSVTDGDTVRLTNGQRVRLLQIDTPELGTGECYSRAARNALLTLVPVGSRVRLEVDARLDNVDRYGRLLRYVHRGSLNANTTLVRGGAAAPYFYGGDLGTYATRLLADARKAKTAKRGLWGACPGTVLDPSGPVDTGTSGPATKHPPPNGKCDPNYEGGCVPPSPPDLDCADIRAMDLAPIRSIGSDPHRLDGNNDGVGCE